MTKLMQELAAAVDAVDLAKDGIKFEKPKRGEKSVGIMSDPCKRILVARQKAKADLLLSAQRNIHKVVDALLLPEKEREKVVQPLSQENQLLQIKSDVLNILFWGSLVTEFPEICGKGVEIRKGWQVVITPPRKKGLPVGVGLLVPFGSVA